MIMPIRLCACRACGAMRIALRAWMHDASPERLCRAASGRFRWSPRSCSARNAPDGGISASAAACLPCSLRIRPTAQTAPRADRATVQARRGKAVRRHQRRPASRNSLDGRARPTEPDDGWPRGAETAPSGLRRRSIARAGDRCRRGTDWVGVWAFIRTACQAVGVAGSRSTAHDNATSCEFTLC